MPHIGALLHPLYERVGPIRDALRRRTFIERPFGLLNEEVVRLATKSSAARRGLLVAQSGFVLGAPATSSMMPSVTTMYEPTLTSGA